MQKQNKIKRTFSVKTKNNCLWSISVIIMQWIKCYQRNKSLSFVAWETQWDVGSRPRFEWGQGLFLVLLQILHHNYTSVCFLSPCQIPIIIWIFKKIVTTNYNIPSGRWDCHSCDRWRSWVGEKERLRLAFGVVDNDVVACWVYYFDRFLVKENVIFEISSISENEPRKKSQIMSFLKWLLGSNYIFERRGGRLGSVLCHVAWFWYFTRKKLIFVTFSTKWKWLVNQSFAYLTEIILI